MPWANSTRLWVCSQLTLPRTISSAWFASKRGEPTKPSLRYRKPSICPAGCMASARSATSTPGWGDVATPHKSSYPSPSNSRGLTFLPSSWRLSTPAWARNKRPSTTWRRRTLNVVFRPIPPFRSPLEQSARGAALPGFCSPHRAFFLSLACANSDRTASTNRSRAQPHMRRAVSATSLSLAHCRSSVIRLPSAVEAKPHCGLSARFSMGT